MKNRLVKGLEGTVTVGLVVFELIKFAGVFATLHGLVSPWALWGYLVVLMACIWPYAHGWFRLVPALRHHQMVSAVRWGAVTAAGFAVPYVYLAPLVGEVSWQLLLGVGLFAALALGLAVRRLIRSLRAPVATEERGGEHEAPCEPEPQSTLGG